MTQITLSSTGLRPWMYMASGTVQYDMKAELGNLGFIGLRIRIAYRVFLDGARQRWCADLYYWVFKE